METGTEKTEHGTRPGAVQTVLRLMAGVLLTGMTLGGLVGCTFVQQSDDLLSGGPERRMESAVQRQKSVIEEQHRLEQTQRELAGLQESEERKLRELRRRLEDQNARLARAKQSQRITEEQEQRLRTRVDVLNREIRSLVLRIDAAKATDERQDEARLTRELEALKREADTIEREIRSLEE